MASELVRISSAHAGAIARSRDEVVRDADDGAGNGDDFVGDTDDGGRRADDMAGDPDEGVGPS